MRSLFSTQTFRSSWLRRGAMIGSVVAILVAILLLLRHRDETAANANRSPSPFPRQKSGYENRGVWRSSRAPTEASGAAKAPKITGTVYETSGRPVAGVQVSAQTFQVAGNQPTTAGSAESDQNGRFELLLPDGSYYLSGDKSGYGSVLAIAHSGDDIGLVLEQGGAFTGHVRDDRGEPITRFSIDVVGASSEDMAAPAPYVSKQFDSPDGSFRIEQVPAWGVTLRATAQGYAPSFSATVKVPPGGEKAVDLTLAGGCVVTGVVEDEEGTPLSDVFIDAELSRDAGVVGTASMDAASRAESDTEGRFRLEHVPLGDVLIRAYDGSHAVSTLTATLGSCDGLAPLSLRMSAGGGLAGRVLGGDGKPVAGARLTLTHRSIGFVNTMSDAQGHYAFDKLPPGGMRLEASRGFERAVGLVTIEDGTITERDLPFPPGGTGEIRGRVTAGGKPLKGMQMMIATTQASGNLGMHYPLTDDDGTYRATGLTEGMYAVLLPATHRIMSASVAAGSVETVDVDVAAAPAAAPRPRLPAAGDGARAVDDEQQPE